MDNLSISFKSNAFGGLSKEQVIKSREEFGRNLLTKKKQKGFFLSLLENFGDPMIKVLLIALAINIIFIFNNSNWFESLGIAIAVLIAVIVTTVSEYGSEAAFNKLQEAAMSIRCRVKREGITIELPMNEIVVGDIIVLSAGDRVPADGVIVSGKLEVDQSALNGETKEAKKYCPDYGINNYKSGDFLNPELVFSGTIVTSGDAFVKITAVGDKTYYGKIAVELQDNTPKSPLRLKLERLAKKISVFGYIGAGLVAFSYLFNVFIIDNGFDGQKILASIQDFGMLMPYLINAVTLSVTVIVMAVPEGLPMMIAVVLSSNMKRMLNDKVFVRKLNGIETAGSMNILFTDKTGTLTDGRLSVANIIAYDGKIHSGLDFRAYPQLCELLSIGIRFNTGSELSGKSVIGGNATDRALLDFAQKIPLKSFNYRVINSVPFSSVNKFMSSKISGDKNLNLIKGAPEKILSACNYAYQADGTIASFINKNAVINKVNDLSKEAMRIVAVATSKNIITNDCELCDLTLIALVGLKDQIRKEAYAGVRNIQNAGIQVVMLTGDSLTTAKAVACEIGIIKPNQKSLAVTSDELAKMNDNELKAALPSLCVVARALPSDKSRLVKIAQSLNLVVGMTGDGINDAPALKKADVGFAMGSGSEIAKDAGCIVILDDNIMSISRAVSYGRTIFKSIRKFIIFQLTINFCAMTVSVFAPLLNVDMPITVIQMLWINLVMDTLAGLAFGGERPRIKYMSEPPKKRDEPIINKYMWQQIIITSVYVAAMSIWFLKSGLIQNRLFENDVPYALTAFFALFMFTAIFNSLNARTHELNLTDYLALNKQFIWIMGGVVVLQVVIIYLGGNFFRTKALALSDFLIILVLAFSVIPLDLLRKVITRRRGVTTGT